MKVFFINAECGKGGGPATIVNDVCKQVYQYGGKAIVAYGLQSSDEVETYKIGNKIGRYFHALETRIFDNHGCGSRIDTGKLLKEIDRFEPDIVNLHNIHGYYLNYPMLFEYLAQKDIPVVWTLHDCWVFTGHCAYFDRVGCEKWKDCCHDCVNKHEYPKSVLMDNSRRNYLLKKKVFTSVKNMTIVTPSEWLADLVKQSFLSKYDCKVINNGIDLTIFRPLSSNFREENNLIEKKIVLCVASTWEARKGLDDVIKLAKVLDTSYKVIVVGLTQQQIDKMPKEILAISRTDNVEELVKIYSSADVFFNPTYEDNYPTVNMEAISCGTPVVTYDTGGCKEQVNGIVGTSVERGDYRRAASEIQKICENRINSQDCIDFSQRFERDEAYRKYIELFNDILKDFKK